MRTVVKYKVNERFTHTQYLNRGEITVAMLNQAFFDVVCVLENITKQEKREWCKGKLNIHLYEDKDIPFVCLDFGTWNLDVNINVNKFKKEHVDAWLNSESNVINLFLVDATTGNLVGMRMISLPISFADRIRDVCEFQSVKSKEDVDSQISKTLQLVSTHQMMKESKLRFSVKS